ncbi:hypothetical protein O181_018684 [Austropuccinia psidii MF-1]|uniref:Uncharacterized protein n=1 Tax=Austropuccinia psidii MF-1 TaxID=1389203 RepID=A0A9Q3C852_9BASI|nr:hypothetical protein [Austropuccinia psidii MF-1]
MKVLKQNRLLQVESLHSLSDDYVKIPQEYEKQKLENDLIKRCLAIWEELTKVHENIGSFVDNNPRLASFRSALSFTEPASSSLSNGLSALEHFSFGKLGKEVNLPQITPLDQGTQLEGIVEPQDKQRGFEAAQVLNTILHKLDFLLIDAQISRNEKERRRGTRVLFESHIFQTLKFLYENQLCDQNALKAFFATENTLERTYEHIRNLYKRRSPRIVDAYFILMPELSFVLKDWNTAHLHSLLRDLEKAQQAHLVELMLIGTIEDFKQSYLFHQASPEIKAIIDVVTEQRILKHWWLNESPNPLQKENVKNWFLQLVKYFGYTDRSKKRFEYLISYYLLNFIKTYQANQFQTLPFSDLEKFMSFETKFSLIQAGARRHQAANRSLDYQRLFLLPSDEKSYLTTEITDEMIRSAVLEAATTTKDYKLLKDNIEKLGHSNQDLLNWKENNFLLQHYDALLSDQDRSNIWTYGRLPSRDINIQDYSLPKDAH